jgi:acyl-CoA dehydrogenase
MDFVLTGGELFATIVYATGILENSRIYKIDGDLIDQMFDCLVRDMSKFALEQYSKPTSTEEQMEHCLKIVRKPHADSERARRVWDTHVYAQRDAYEMPR